MASDWQTFRLVQSLSYDYAQFVIVIVIPHYLFQLSVLYLAAKISA